MDGLSVHGAKKVMIVALDEGNKYYFYLFRSHLDFMSKISLRLLINKGECIGCKETLKNCECDYCEEPDMVARLFQCEVYGRGDDFSGRYMIGVDDWRELAGSMRHDINQIAENSPINKRKGVIKNKQHVVEWLNSAYGDHSLAIKKIHVPLSDLPGKRQRKLTKIYNACFRNSESSEHSILKWSGYCLLSGGDPKYFDYPACSNPIIWGRSRGGGLKVLAEDGINFEVTYAIPGNRYSKTPRQGAGVITICEMYHGFWNSHIQKVADIYSGQHNLIVECGATSPFSLIEPVIKNVVDATVWVPFGGKGFDYKQEQCVEAYFITKPESLKKRVYKRLLSMST